MKEFNKTDLRWLVIAFEKLFIAKPTLFGYVNSEVVANSISYLEEYSLTPWEIDPDNFHSPSICIGKQAYVGHSIMEVNAPFVLCKGLGYWYGLDKNEKIVFFRTMKESRERPSDYYNYDISHLMRPKKF